LAKSFPGPIASFDVDAFLVTTGPGHSVTGYKGGDTVFSQGDRADDIFYVREGKIKITIISQRGKEAVIAIVPAGEFFGELALNGQRIRPATAVAMEDCKIVRMSRSLMLSTLGSEPEFSKLFIEHLLLRNRRIEEDLVDQLFNSSEKRLARILLLLANFGKEDKPETVIPDVTQAMLAEMIGTTRSRVSFFMNKFRRLGFIEYNGKIQIHSSLLNVVLHD
jgi:CRP/FNR family transcriptional regulator, cyclic AMP receptor protein